MISQIAKLRESLVDSQSKVRRLAAENVSLKAKVHSTCLLRMLPDKPCEECRKTVGLKMWKAGR